MSFKKEIGEIYRLKVPFENLYTSVFLIQTESANILVDCATTQEDVQEWILPALKEKGLSIQDIQFLLLTHKHADHAGGVSEILKLHPAIETINTVCQRFENLEIYSLQGHTEDCIGVLDVCAGTLISGDGLQGVGIGQYRCSLENKEEYIKTIHKIRKDQRIKNLLFSHAYEPWNKDAAFGREAVEKCLQDCIKYVERSK